MSVHAPASQRSVAHKSPFATLLGTGDLVPASHRRQTLMSVGTPLSVLAPLEAAPESAPLSPALPVWGASLSTAPAPASDARTSSSAVVARATLESIPLSEVAKFRGSSRRTLIVLTLVALLGVVIAVVASQSSGEAADHNAQAQAAAPGVVAPKSAAPEPEATPDEADRPTLPSATDPNSSAPAITPKELRPAAKAPSPARAASSTGTKDYGI
jgi:hypothetical protein